MSEIHFILDLTGLTPEDSLGLSISLLDCFEQFLFSGSPKALNFFWRERLNKRERKILRRAISKTVLNLSKRKEKLIAESSDVNDHEALKRWIGSQAKFPPAEQILKRIGFRPSLDSSVDDKGTPTSKSDSSQWREAIFNARSFEDIHLVFKGVGLLDQGSRPSPRKSTQEGEDPKGGKG